MRPEEKAAALVVAVGSKAASGMLEYLNDDEVERLATEVAKIGRLHPETVDAVFTEVYEEATAQQLLAAGGIDYAREMLVDWRGERGHEIVERLISDLEATPFGFVRKSNPEKLSKILAEEHPQTVALVLAHQPAAFAATVLGFFDDEIQAEIALRVGTMGKTSPDVIRSIESYLQSQVGPEPRTELAVRGGIEELAEVLNNSNKETEKAILERLASIDSDLAEEVQALMFVFADIITLDDRAIQRVLQDVNTQELALAMKGIGSEVSDAIVRNMSSRAAESLKEEIELLGPARRSDVEAARRKVVAAVRLLEETGEIVISRGGESELIE
ncbi:MAG: flagellar motor switch protein FliG [Acidimicrobiia bacterium]|nr:flagellar motor switch protein FliG [Acidimicrobiia bacterium]